MATGHLVIARTAPANRRPNINRRPSPMPGPQVVPQPRDGTQEGQPSKERQNHTIGQIDKAVGNGQDVFLNRRRSHHRHRKESSHNTNHPQAPPDHPKVRHRQQRQDGHRQCQDGHQQRQFFNSFHNHTPAQALTPPTITAPSFTQSHPNYSKMNLEFQSGQVPQTRRSVPSRGPSSRIV